MGAKAEQEGRVLKVELQEAAARLPDLVDRVRRGEDVVLSDGELEVRLVLLPPGRRILGQDAGLFEVPEDFDERQALAEALWDSLGSEPASLSPERKTKVSNRISQFERGEVEPVPWSEVEATIRATLGR